MTPYPHHTTGAGLWNWRQGAIAAAQSADIDPQEVDWLLIALAEVDGLALRLGTVAGRPQVGLRVPLAELQQRWQQRRIDRVPVQYLVGETPWRDLVLAVSPAVLIPRPETELIVDLATEFVTRSPLGPQLAQGTWADLGTGSGAIAIALARAFPTAQVLAVDQSAAALAVAADNAHRHGVADRIAFYQGSWFDPLATHRGQLSAVVANPPYIPSALVPTLQPEVARHEPATALDGGPDGLDDLRAIAAQAPEYLVSGGLWLVELMAGQGEAVRNLLTELGCYSTIEICGDLAGRDRFVRAVYRP